MPLTPEDVRNKQFTETKMRRGYEQDEVDAFLDEVEAEIGRLLRENAELRARAGAPAGAGVTTGSNAPSGGPSAASVPAGSAPAVRTDAPAVPGMRPGEAPSDAALRMLSMAQKTADETMSDARREAEKVLTEARTKREQIERELSERHASMMGNLAKEREELESKVANLRSFEREYRARLKAYLENQLRDLEGRGAGSVAPAAPAQPAPTGRPAPVPSEPFPAPLRADSSVGIAVEAPSGPPREVPGTGPFAEPATQPTKQGFEIDEGPEVPPTRN